MRVMTMIKLGLIHAMNDLILNEKSHLEVTDPVDTHLDDSTLFTMVEEPRAGQLDLRTGDWRSTHATAMDYYNWYAFRQYQFALWLAGHINGRASCY